MSSETFKYFGIAFAVAFIILFYLNFRKSWALKREMTRNGLITRAEVINVIKIHVPNWSENVSDQWNDNSQKVRYEVGFKDRNGTNKKAILTGYKVQRVLKEGDIVNVKYSEKLSGFVQYSS